MSLDIPVADWVRRAQEGDVRAFEQLFQQYHRGIYNTIYQMTHNDADAADLTQEVFVRAYRALPRLQTPEAFTSWLYRIAVNLSRNWLRDRGPEADGGIAGMRRPLTSAITAAAKRPDPAAHGVDLIA